MLWGHRNDPVNFHRCLQDFDRRLPDLLDALRPERPPHPDLGSRLRPDDAVDRPLARVRAAARVRRGAERGGPDPRGRRVRRRRRDRQRLARRRGGAARRPGRADRRAVTRLDDPHSSRASTPTRRACGGAQRRSPADRRGRGRARPRRRGRGASSGPSACSRSAAAGASSQRGSDARPALDVIGRRPVAAHGRARRERGVDARRSPTCSSCRSRTARSTSRSRRGCSTTCPISIGRRGARARAAARRPSRGRDQLDDFHLHELRELVGSGPSTLDVLARERRGAPRASVRDAFAATTSTVSSSSRTAARSRSTCAPRSRCRRSSGTCPEAIDEPFFARRATLDLRRGEGAS